MPQTEVDEQSFTPRKKAREKPLLVPPCRKLRHLTSLSVRNLSATRPRKPRTDRAADDAKLNTHSANVQRTPKGKQKSTLLTVEGGNYLQHSRSSTDLVGQKDFELWNATANAGSGTGSGLASGSAQGKGKGRASAGSSDGSGEEKKEDVREARSDKLLDCFFSLHCTEEEPVYISEIVERTLNPNFQTFDLSNAGPEISRRDTVTVKLWVKEHRIENWTLLLELELALEALQFIGTSLETFRHPLPRNCVVFHLTDGCYTTFTDMAPTKAAVPEPPSRDRIGEYNDTSSYDSLLKLRNLQECIDDAEETQATVSSQIEDVMNKNADGFHVEDALSEARERLSQIQSRLKTEQKRNNTLESRRKALAKQIETRKALLEAATTGLSSSKTHLKSAVGQLSSSSSTLDVTREALQAQRRRILTDLQKIYPIEPNSNGDFLSFTIRSIPLPNLTTSTTFDIPDDQLNAALGYTAQLVHNLALYLSVPLRYPIYPQASTSSIEDPISNLAQGSSRVFPLYRTGSQLHRFDYGVFLLNKDIELLCASCGVSVVDIRHTLPNLKYLMYIVGEWGSSRREKLVK